MAPDFTRYLLKIVFTYDFSSVLTQNYQILKIFSLYTEYQTQGKRSDPKITGGRPCTESVYPSLPQGYSDSLLLLKGHVELTQIHLFVRGQTATLLMSSLKISQIVSTKNY